MRLFVNFARLNLLFCLFLLLYLSVLNQKADEVIPLIHIGSVLCIFMLYNITVSHLFFKIYESSWMPRFLYLLGYGVLFYTLTPVVSFLVHDLYPLIGIQLFDADLPFDVVKFEIRLIKGFSAISMAAAFIVFIVKMIQYAKVKRKNEYDLGVKLNAYQLRIEKNQWKSHFLTNIFSVSFGRRLIDDTPKKQTEIFDIIQFLDYQLNAHFSLVAWEEESDQLDCFIRLLRYQYGQKSVLFDNQLSTSVSPNVPYDILLFPLENCLKHGEFSEKDPVVYQLKNTQSGFQMICTNKISLTNLQDLNQRSGTGIEMLKLKMEQSSFPIQYQVALNNGHFTLMINFNYTGDEEGNL